MAERTEKEKSGKNTERASAPADIQNMIGQFQMMQQQLQAVFIQKEGAGIQITENEKALAELGKVKANGDVYKAVGNILIKSTPDALKKELSEEKETMETRIKAMEKQEKFLKERLVELEGKLRASMGKKEGGAVE